MIFVQLFSDTHFEFHKDRGNEFLRRIHRNVDVLVLAGDIDNFHGIEESLTKICQKYDRSEVLYVHGNHEGYGGDLYSLQNKLRDLERKIDNLTWLENKRVEINGQGFIGATLWFPSSVNTDMMKHNFTDFIYIKDADPFVFLAHDESERYFRNNIREGDIVISHHMPSYICVDHRYKMSALNCFFSAELSDIIVATKPAYWLYGHTHLAGEHFIADTRLLCNPLAYPAEQGKNGFMSDLILDI